MQIISVSPCMAFFAWLTESLQYWMIYFASLYSETPAFVRRRPQWVRSKSFTSRASSSRFICLITAVGVMNIRSATLLKLPASAAVRKVSSWGLYIGRLIPVSVYTLEYTANRKKLQMKCEKKLSFLSVSLFLCASSWARL